jgi:hypothetical protein
VPEVNSEEQKEYIFYMVKRLFGCRKAVYRGILKNTGRLYMLFASANLLKWAWTMCPVKWAAGAVIGGKGREKTLLNGVKMSLL